MAKRASSRLVRNRNLNNEIEDEIEKIVDDEAKNAVDPPAGSRKRKKGGTRDEPEQETQLDEPAQSLPTTSKDRLLRLLDKHIQKKKPRRSCAGPPKSTIQNIPNPIISIQTEVQDQLDVQEDQVDYSIFAMEDLVRMVSEVGVDTRGMDKLDLIRNCEKFRDLIITPQNPRIDHVEKDISKSVKSTGTGEKQSNTIKTSKSAFPSPVHEKPSNIQSSRTIPSSKPESSRKKKKQAGPENSATEQPQSNTLKTSTLAVPSSAHETSSNNQSSRTIRSSEPGSSRKTKKQAGPENSATEQPQSNTIRTSTPVVPSSAHETSSNIQSSRTIRSSKAESSSNKKEGKERAREETEDDYEEEQASGRIHNTDHDPDSSVEIFYSHKSKKRNSTKNKNKRTEEEEDLGQSEVNNTTKEKSNACNKHFCLATSQKVEKLAQEVRYLTEVVEGLVGKDGETVVKKKTRGGRTSAHIRFHVDVMLGRKSDTSPPPPPASTEEKLKWMYDQDIDTIDIDISDLSHPSGDQNAADPSLPYLDGPGHPDATPQQLAVIMKLMKSVGMESFRPDFANSAQSPENKWLWEISEKIFIKLVGYGEYPGVSLDTENRQYITKCFATYFQSLKKRYRKEHWQPDRQKAADDTNRRTTRLGRLRKARKTIIMNHRSLWPLLPLVESACSDDETDPESASDTTPGDKTPIHVKNLQWRSQNLSNIWKRLDESQARFKRSLTGSNYSSPRGRPSRPRIRVQNPFLSKIPVPENLPKDCYSNEFLHSLTAKEKAQMNIDNRPIIPAICNALDGLGF